MTIFDRTMQLLHRTLDLRQARQRVIASNIANEETPGYRATELNFQDSLQAAQRGRRSCHARGDSGPPYRSSWRFVSAGHGKAWCRACRGSALGCEFSQHRTGDGENVG